MLQNGETVSYMSVNPNHYTSDKILRPECVHFSWFVLNYFRRYRFKLLCYVFDSDFVYYLIIGANFKLEKNVIIYSTPKETHHLYAFAVVKKSLIGDSYVIS